MVEASKKGEHITMGTPFGNGSDQETNEFGLPFMHAFTILGVTTVIDESNYVHRLVSIRNPWGEEWYFGDWSDSSDRWTDSLREQADHMEANDGKFFMNLDDYIA